MNDKYKKKLDKAKEAMGGELSLRMITSKDIAKITNALELVQQQVKVEIAENQSKATEDNTKKFEELSNYITKLTSIINDGLKVNNLDDIKQAESIIVKNLKDIPTEVTVKNQTEIPKWLASEKSIEKLDKSVKSVVQKLIDLEANIKPSQNPDEFIPFRRVYRRNNKLMFDDGDWTSVAGGGGGGSSSGGSGGAVTIADGADVALGATNDAAVSTDANGTLSAKVRGIIKLLVSFIKNEDAGHTTGDAGIMALAVRNDALAAFSNTDLDYTPIAVTSAGRIQTTIASHSAMVRGNNSVAGTGSTAVTGTISGDASLKTYITDIQVSNTGTSTTLITLQDGSGGTTLGYLIAPAGGGDNAHYTVPLVTTANTALYFACGTSSTTVYVSAQGYKAP